MEKILVLGPFNTTMRRELQRWIPADRFLLEFAEEIQPEQLAEADYIILRTLRLDAAEIAELNHAKLIQRWGAGYDTVDIEAPGRRASRSPLPPG